MKYALKKVRCLRIYDLATGEHKVTFNDLKSVKLTGSNDTVYAEGADGAVLAAFDAKKVTNLEAENGTIDTGFIALQNGTKVEAVTNGAEISIREAIKLSSATTFVLSNNAEGTVGAELKFIYKSDKGGVVGKSFTQVGSSATLATGQFQYDASTKTVTLFEGDFVVGEEIIVDYNPKFSKYNKITNEAEKFAETGKVVVDGWFTDLCDNTDVPLQIVLPKGKISGEYDFTFGDSAAVQGIKIEGLAGSCTGDNTLWQLFDYDMTDIV